MKKKYTYMIEAEDIDGTWIRSVHFPYIIDKKSHAVRMAELLQDMWKSRYRAQYFYEVKK